MRPGEFNKELEELIARYLSGQIQADELQKLHIILSEDSQAKKYFCEMIDLHTFLSKEPLLKSELENTENIKEPIVYRKKLNVGAIRALKIVAVLFIIIFASLAIVYIINNKAKQPNINQGDKVIVFSPAKGWLAESRGARYRMVRQGLVFLERGELYVYSNNEKAEPKEKLVIETVAGKATALGTKFYIGTHQIEENISNHIFKGDKEVKIKGVNRKEMLKQLTRVFVLSGSVMLSNSLGSLTGSSQELMASTVTDAPIKQTLKANNDFTVRLYKQLAKENKGENMFFSSYSISSAFAMATEGTRGDTAKEMGDVLGYPESIRRMGDDAQSIPWETSVIHSGFKEINDSLNAKSKDYKLSVANAIWAEKTFPVKQSFQDSMAKYYDKKGMFGANFAGEPEKERLRINQWVEDHTNNKIKNLFKNPFDSDVRMVLVNAIYFKGDWQTPFSEKLTRKRKFHLASGQKQETDIMYNYHIEGCRFAAFDGNGKTQKLSYRVEPDTKGFMIGEMPYKGGELSMTLIVPNTVHGLNQLENSISDSKLEQWFSALKKEKKLNVFLPKFKLEGDYRLNETMKSMGMRKAFSSRQANFTGINESSDLYIAEAVHKSFLEVNEKGSEASAATGFKIVGTSLGPYIPTINCSRPFIMMIRHNKTGSILFMGRMLKPVD